MLHQDFAELYFKYISSWQPYATGTYKKQVQNPQCKNNMN